MSTIYKKNILSSIDDFQKHGNSFNPGANLTALLSTINLNTTPNNRWHVKIRLTEPGDYYITETLTVNCDFTIEGCENARIIANFSNNDAYHHDCFIFFCNYNSNGEKTRCKTIIKNVEFGVHANHHWRTINNEPAELHYLKIYYPQSLHIDNVKMSLSDHPITNIDIRNGQNVLIENCVLENYHDNVNVNAGGNLWLRAITQNVKIINNVFKKTGNDEALAFFGHHTDDDYILPADDIPADGNCRKQNIIVSNNVFEYGEPGTIEADIINDCLISLTDTTSNQAQTLKHVYDNIAFEGNTIVVNDLVRRLFSCINRERTIIRNVRFENNNIKINGFTASSVFCNIFELHNMSSDVVSLCQVKGNNVYNKAKIIDDNKTGLHFIYQNGGNVSVLDNFIRIYESDDIDQKYRKFIFFWINKMNSTIYIENNNIFGCHLLGSINCPTSSGEQAINYAKVIIKNNVIKGGTSVYTHNIGWLVLSIEDNYIDSEEYIIALQDYGNSGYFSYINNHVLSKYSGSPTFYYSSTGCNASRICVSNNVFESATSSIFASLHSYTSISIRTEINNFFLN